MKQPAGWKRRAWFGVGVTLLAISALWWLLLILADPEDIYGVVLTGVVTTVVPIGIGVFCVMRGRKPRGVEVQQSPEPTYVSQPVAKPAQSVKLGREVQADFDKLEAEILSRKKSKTGDDISGWKAFPIVLGLIVAQVAVASFVESLTIYPSWLRFVLYFLILAAGFIVSFSKKLWLQIPFFTALGIFVIYTIRGIILGNIDLFIPFGPGGP